MTGTRIDVVICTHDRAAVLDRALAALAAQRGAPPGAWSVTVVDNACTDDTPEVVARHAGEGDVPGLRRVLEDRSGLTHARLRGVRSTSAPWVAFVDDDCLLAEDWLARALALVAEADGTCGALGGRIVLDWDSEPPESVRPYGWALAEQDRGERPCVVDGLAGAGMLVRRAALEDCGWTTRPLLDDRVGERLVSGGDVEIVARLSGHGYALRYEPGLVLRHLMPAARAERRYLAAVIRGLGASSAYYDLMVGRRGAGAWAASVAGGVLRDVPRLVRKLGEAAVGRRGLTGPALDACFLLGRLQGVGRVVRAGRARRAELRGAALRRG